ncbi:MAG: hypothetical protein ABIF71_01015, partial [Planctomycetota bacterium]
RETAIKGGFQTRPYGNHPNRPMVDSRAWLTPKSAKAFSAGIRKSALPPIQNKNRPRTLKFAEIH